MQYYRLNLILYGYLKQCIVTVLPAGALKPPVDLIQGLSRVPDETASHKYVLLLTE